MYPIEVTLLLHMPPHSIPGNRSTIFFQFFEIVIQNGTFGALKISKITAIFNVF